MLKVFSKSHELVLLREKVQQRLISQSQCIVVTVFNGKVKHGEETPQLHHDTQVLSWTAMYDALRKQSKLLSDLIIRHFVEPDRGISISLMKFWSLW
jgi:hypothetical protein